MRVVFLRTRNRDAILITGQCGLATSFSNGGSLMTPETHVTRTLPLLLHIATVTTGLIDALSYLALGHVFTANMTGNVVFLGFAVAGAPELSIARSLTALVAFLIGALIGGRIATHLSEVSKPSW